MKSEMSPSLSILTARGLVLALAAGLVLAGCSARAATPSPLPTIARNSASPSMPVSAQPTAGPTSSPGTPSSSPPPASESPAASGSAGSGYTTTVDNPFFPLVPGTILTYQGTKDGHAAVEEFEVKSDTTVIDGVTCVVTEDRVSLGGVPTENTLGYYAQDSSGSVWYFGEDVQEVGADGTAHTVDSWRAGLDTAQPQMIMPGAPAVGQAFDHPWTQTDFSIEALDVTMDVPAGSFSGVLMTKEWSPVEPNVVVHKYYAPGVGMIRDVSISGPYEEVQLQSR